VSPWKLEVGPPLPIRSHGEPLSGPPPSWCSTGVVARHEQDR
jgi:hypothetical protein